MIENLEIKKSIALIRSNEEYLKSQNAQLKTQNEELTQKLANKENLLREVRE